MRIQRKNVSLKVKKKKKEATEQIQDPKNVTSEFIQNLNNEKDDALQDADVYQERVKHYTDFFKAKIAACGDAQGSRVKFVLALFNCLNARKEGPKKERAIKTQLEFDKSSRRGRVLNSVNWYLLTNLLEIACAEIDKQILTEIADFDLSIFYITQKMRDSNKEAFEAFLNAQYKSMKKSYTVATDDKTHPYHVFARSINSQDQLKLGLFNSLSFSCSIQDSRGLTPQTITELQWLGICAKYKEYADSQWDAKSAIILRDALERLLKEKIALSLQDKIYGLAIIVKRDLGILTKKDVERFDSSTQEQSGGFHLEVEASVLAFNGKMDTAKKKAAEAIKIYKASKNGATPVSKQLALIAGVKWQAHTVTDAKAKKQLSPNNAPESSSTTSVTWKPKKDGSSGRDTSYLDFQKYLRKYLKRGLS